MLLENPDYEAFSIDPLDDFPIFSIVFNDKSQALNSPLGVQKSSSSSGPTVSLSNASLLRIFMSTPNTSREISSIFVRLSKPIPMSLPLSMCIVGK
jgi:hypothetical protein